MAGRPKREEDVTSVLLRLPPALLKRIERCQATLALQEDTRLTRTEAFWRILEAGCETLESIREGRATPAPAHMPISEISEISDISGDDISVPGYGFPEDEETPEPLAAPVASAVQTAVATAGIPQHIQTIAEVAAQYDKLTLAQLAQLLYDRDIYRARDRKTGEEKVINRGTLQKWLDQARAAGVL